MRVLVGFVIGVVVLGGCSSEGAGEGSAPDAASSASTQPTSVASSGSPTVSPTGSPSESADPSPSVEPATGQLVEMGALSLRVPANYVVDRFDDESYSARGKGIKGSLATMGALRIDSLGTPASLRTALKNYRSTNSYLRDPEEREPVVVGGLKMFHIAGMSNDDAWTEAYGIETAQNVYAIDFEFIAQFTPATKRRKIIDSVLATVEINEP